MIYLKNENGFSSPLALAVIFSFCIIVGSYAMLVTAMQKKILAYENYYQDIEDAENLIKDFVWDFQNIIKAETDSPHNSELNRITEKYKRNSVQLKDISTGINENTLSSKIIDSNYFKKLLVISSDDIRVDYGWFSEKYSDKEKLEMIKHDFENMKIPQIINGLPMFNCYNMDENFIEAILGYNKIENSYEKSVLLKNELNKKELSIIEMSNILGVSKNSSVFDFLGTKTNFWSVHLITEKCDIVLIIVGIPDEKEPKRIGKYMVINKKIFSKGGLL